MNNLQCPQKLMVRTIRMVQMQVVSETNHFLSF